MYKTLAIAAILALPLVQSHCEELAKPRAFEVASIAPCKPGTPEPPGHGPPMIHWVYPGGRFNAEAARVTYLVEWAYGIIPEQHSKGPSWMDEELYNIVATAGSEASEHEMKLMLRTLLAERFHLKFHLDRKEMPVVAVSLGKAPPKLLASKDQGEPHSIKIVPQPGSDPKAGAFHVVATRFTIGQLNETFARALSSVIVDRTGLKGDFDFTIDLPFDADRPNPLDPSNILNAMRDQLGFTVKSQKGLADFYVIDSVERVAAGN